MYELGKVALQADLISSIVHISVSLILLLIGILVRNWIRDIHAMIKIVAEHTTSIALIQRDILLLGRDREACNNKTKELENDVEEMREKMSRIRDV